MKKKLAYKPRAFFKSKIIRKETLALEVYM